MELQAIVAKRSCLSVGGGGSGKKEISVCNLGDRLKVGVDSQLSLVCVKYLLDVELNQDVSSPVRWVRGFECLSKQEGWFARSHPRFRFLWGGQ